MANEQALHAPAEKKLSDLLPRGWNRILRERTGKSKTVVHDSVHGLTTRRAFNLSVFEAAAKLAEEHQAEKAKRTASAKRSLKRAARLSEGATTSTPA